MSHFADALKELRLKRGLTQAALACELQVSQNAVFNWENGKREPTIEMIEKIADYFQISTAYLFAEKESYRAMLRFLDEFSKGKVPAANASHPVDRGCSMEAGSKAAQNAHCDFVMADEAGAPLAVIELMGTDMSYQHLIAYVRRCYDWYKKTYEPLNEDGRDKVVEYAELLSESEKFRRKLEEPA